MRYLLALVLPPIAVLMCGKPVQFVLNIVLTFFGFIPGIVHAILVVNDHKASLRNDKLIKAIGGH
jgi:uncharacterized membrane protein YqaE (UPF0057 family)